jgi:hypothetical protein
VNFVLSPLLSLLVLSAAYAQQYTVTTIAGSGSSDEDDVLAVQSSVHSPRKLARDSAGNIYFADSGKLGMVDARGVVITLAANGIVRSSGDGGSFSAAGTGVFENGFTVAPDGSIYLPEVYYIRKVTNGIIDRFAGHGGSLNDNISALDAAMQPKDVVLDSSGNLIIADWVRRYPAPFNELRIFRKFEVLHPVRLQSKGMPDSDHSGLRQAGLLRHEPRAPMCLSMRESQPLFNAFLTQHTSSQRNLARGEYSRRASPCYLTERPSSYFASAGVAARLGLTMFRRRIALPTGAAAETHI